MGNTLNSVEHLGAPFRSVDEQVFVIPRDGRHEIANRFFKIIFMLEGSCLHEVDDDKPVPFESGDVIVIPRVGCQRYLAAGPRAPRRVHALRLIFDLPALTTGQRRPAVRGDVEMELAAFMRHHLHEVRHLPQGQDEFIRPLLIELRQEAEQRRAGYRFRVTALCSAMTVHIIRCLSQSAARAMTPTTTRRRRAFLVLQAKEYLLKNLKEDLRLDQIAWQLRVSAEHLARAFKQETGQTVFTHLQNLRIEQAKTYLIGSEQTITAIAARTGFNSVAHFSRSFKDYCGVSPRVYRQERWSRATENGRSR